MKIIELLLSSQRIFHNRDACDVIQFFMHQHFDIFYSCVVKEGKQYEMKHATSIIIIIASVDLKIFKNTFNCLQRMHAINVGFLERERKST